MALFAVLLFVLGWVLAHEILGEVEARVEKEQRFILEVATLPGFALGEETLRELRDRASRSADPTIPAAHGDFVVLHPGSATLSTLARTQWKTVEALEAAVKSGKLVHPDKNIARDIELLDREKWLVLHTARSSRGPGADQRHFYLLYPYADIEQAKNRALMRILSLGGIGLALAAGLGLLVAHWISSPVRRLAEAAKQVSAGGLNESVEPVLFRNHNHALQPHRGGDEIQELTQSFQSMLLSLRASQNDLLKAERLAVTGKLAASVAHEIRNPLTSLRMTVQMLQQRADAADKTTHEAYVIVLSEIDRLALSVEELLTFARPRPPQRAATDLNKLVTDTLSFLERQLAHARVKAVSELDNSVPKDHLVDANKIRQLLVNLILNAQQAIVRDGTITVRTEWNSQKKEVSLSVRDTGPGIAEEVRGKLFELFVSTKVAGGGLGLAIAKQIAEEHGGTISYVTSPQGTTFTVAIPGGVQTAP